MELSLIQSDSGHRALLTPCIISTVLLSGIANAQMSDSDHVLRNSLLCLQETGHSGHSHHRAVLRGCSVYRSLVMLQGAKLRKRGSQGDMCLEPWNALQLEAEQCRALTLITAVELLQPMGMDDTIEGEQLPRLR